MTRPAPLADLSLLVALVAPGVLGVWAGRAAHTGSVALLILVVGAGVALLVGRWTRGFGPTLSIAIPTWVTLVVCFIAVGVSTFGSCDQTRPRYPWIIVGVAGAAYLALGLFSLRKGRLWGVPAAALLAFLIGVAVYHALPTISYYDPSSCFE